MPVVELPKLRINGEMWTLDERRMEARVAEAQKAREEELGDPEGDLETSVEELEVPEKEQETSEEEPKVPGNKPVKKSQKWKCGICKKIGHTAKSCPERK